LECRVIINIQKSSPAEKTLKTTRRSNQSTYIVKYLLALILMFSLVFSFYGCTAPETTTTQAGGNGKSFIWKISSDESFVYLLGSVHVAAPDLYPLDSTIENAFEMSDRLVVEININEVSILKSMLLLQKYGLYPEGEGLKENLPEELYRQLESQLRKTDFPISTINNYRPWVIVALMGATEIGDYSAEYGIDLHFLDKAAEREMEILELETAEYQFEIFSELPDELMILILEMSFEEPDSVEDVEMLFKFWEEGDTAGMADLMFKDLAEEPALAPFYDAFYTQRNYNMAAKIGEYLGDEYIYFIIVGAGHLVGEEGLINLLEEAGYSVEQLGN
jgi:uncharacterized protein YbaP (TraB family)